MADGDHTRYQSGVYEVHGEWTVWSIWVVPQDENLVPDKQFAYPGFLVPAVTKVKRRNEKYVPKTMAMLLVFRKSDSQEF